MGTIIALQIAVWCPERVLGLFLVSPLGLEEVGWSLKIINLTDLLWHQLPDVAAGRQEIYDIWTQGFEEDGTIHADNLEDATRGAIQLAYSDRMTPLCEA